MSSPNVTAARSVSWWPVHEFVTQWLERLDGWPLAGSVEWQQLPDDDPRKWASLLDAAQHWALRVDTAQETRADASRAVAASTDWPKVATELVQRRQWRASRPWSRRVVV